MTSRLYDGSGAAPAETRLLHAGPLSLEYENGLIRNVRLGEQEIVRAVYAAVRDHNWGTVPGDLRDLTLDARENQFDLRFTSDHRQGDIQFVWRGHISGSAEGEIRFDFDGEALTAFKRNRIGFCVLHPMEVAGLACEVVHTDGAAEKTTFPLHISPHQPVYDIRALRHEVLPGLVAEVRMEGDTFEMEDQRNWTDASFKTYCTPLGLPFPAEVKAGDRVQQAVVIRLIGRAPSVAVEAPPLTLAVSDGPAVPVPPIGIGWKAGTALSARERDQLAALRPAHLRVEVYPETALETLAEAANAAHALDTLLEVALHLGEDVEAALRRVAAAADAERPPVARWLVFRKGELSTRRETVQAARAALERFGAPIGAGTDAFFTELNRERPPADLLDWVAYSLNPQVHAFDNASLVETLAAQAATVASARQFSGKARIAVTPVSLKMRWNPNATSAEPPTPAGTLPRQVDGRQMSLFGAAWTLGSLKSLIRAGADSLTYYEALGWLGVIERDAGSPLPELFPSVAGGVHPLYHPLADVLPFGGEALPAASRSPLTSDGLALRKDGRLRLLLANFTAEPQTLLVTGVRGEFAVRALDETTAHAALRSPEAFRAEPGSLHTARADGLRVTLLPYSTLCCDQTH